MTSHLVGILLCLIGSATVSVACTCMHLRGDPAAAFTAASAVFSGNVVDIVEGKPSSPETGLAELAVKFRVEKSWKTILKDEVTVFTVNISNFCGFPFKVGESYLVYGRGGDDKFSTDICTRTVGLMGANEDLEYLKSRLPTVFLNHFYVVIDSATYKDIEQSPFLRKEFAANETRTTVRTDMSYTGLYFYGTNTYFEFFDVASDTSRQIGFSGIAFGVDHADELQAIGRVLSSKFPLVQQTITRQYSGKQVPWFYSGQQAEFPMGSSFSVWLMEYHPQFLSEWNPQPGARNQGTSRKQLLQRYAAVLKDVPAKPYFSDVVALTVAIDDERRKKLAEFCKLLGYSERIVDDAIVLKGRDIEVRLVPQTESARGIREITMRVKRKPKDQSEFRFGTKSVLRFRDNGLATWSF